jgi:hypothetical protein
VGGQQEREIHPSKKQGQTQAAKSIVPTDSLDEDKPRWPEIFHPILSLLILPFLIF